jgi:hypothetical protein
VHKALKQAYRTKILHLEASIIDLRVHATRLAAAAVENHYFLMRHTHVSTNREKAR